MITETIERLARAISEEIQTVALTLEIDQENSNIFDADICFLVRSKVAEDEEITIANAISIEEVILGQEKSIEVRIPISAFASDDEELTEILATEINKLLLEVPTNFITATQSISTQLTEINNSDGLDSDNHFDMISCLGIKLEVTVGRSEDLSLDYPVELGKILPEKSITKIAESIKQ